MDAPPPSAPQKLMKKLFAALNRADELGGEVRDWIQERVVVDPRWIAARRRIARAFGQRYESAPERAERHDAQEAVRAAAAPKTQAPVVKGLGDPGIKAQVYGRKSCPWTGRSITILEKHKVDFDFVDLDDGDHENKLPALTAETQQHTTPFIYLRGQFVGGYNALAEIERLGQLEFALMSAEERAAAPEHLRKIVIVSRPEKDEVPPAEHLDAKPLD